MITGEHILPVEHGAIYHWNQSKDTKGAEQTVAGAELITSFGH